MKNMFFCAWLTSGFPATWPDLRPTISDALRDSSSCVPDGAVLLSAALPVFQEKLFHPVQRQELRSVRSLQFAGVAAMPCLIRRVVSVCFGVDSDSIGTCVAAPSGARGTSQLVWHIPPWNVWGVISQALQVAREVLWVDPSVMVLRNPFLLLRAPGLATADVLYLPDAPCWLAGGAAPSDGGRGEERCASTHLDMRSRPLHVLHARNTSIVAAIASNRATLSQLRARQLPLGYMQHRWDALGGRGVSLCSSATYLANFVALRPPRRGPWLGFKGTPEQFRALVIADEMNGVLTRSRCSDTEGGGGGGSGGGEGSGRRGGSGEGSGGKGPIALPTALWGGTSARDMDVGWRNVRRAGAVHGVDVSGLDFDASRRLVLDALRAAPQVHDSLLAALQALPAHGGSGLWLEFGSWRGDSTRKLAHGACCLGRSARTHAFDSFRGLPERWRGGWFGKASSFDRQGKPPFEDERVRWHVGWFNETLPPFLATHRQNVSLVHVDSDLYSSASFVLRHLAQRLLPGAIIAFDELLNYPEYAEHEMKAFIELLHSTGRRFRPVATPAQLILSEPREIRNALNSRRWRQSKDAAREKLKAMRQEAVVQLL